MAVMADENDKSSVRIATVHAVKGLEFPIVFHYYTKLRLDEQIKYSLMHDKYFIQYFGKFIALRQVAPPLESTKHLRQVAPPLESTKHWEDYFAPCTSVQECVLRTDRPLAYDGLIQEMFAEKWRLYYVAMTRAKDHIFHNMGTPGRNAISSPATSWLARFRQWYDRHEYDECVEIVSSARQCRVNAKAGIRVKSLKFDEEAYAAALEKSKTFMPKILNPSHLYDLIYCPRYYQYNILQNVKGGPHDQFGVPTDFDSVSFGKHVHTALELRDFSQAEPNKEYIEYIKRLGKDANPVKIAVEKFINSDFFKEYDLAKRRALKEFSVLYALEGDGLESTRIYMDDQIDLIIEEPGKGVIVVDYKTNYPIEDNPGTIFLKKHYEYQLSSYVLALEKGLGLNVLKIFLLYYNYQNKDSRWIAQELPKGLIDVEKEILNLMPLKIVKGGLERRVDKTFCEDYCEFNRLCKPF